MSRPKLFLIDSFGFVFRAYHARARMGAPAMRTSKGLSTEAVYIFHNMVRKLFASQKPEHIAAVFESAGPTFRDEAFKSYKANRTEMPPELDLQIPWIRKTLDALRIPILEFPGFEADDVIGTISCRAVEAGMDVVIVSSDKDMLQLVNEHVSMLNPAKEDAWYDPAAVEKFMGVPPGRVADLLALKGDSIDNIPGAPGIGDKGGRDIILRFGSVEAALERAHEVERKMYRESLLNNREQILLSKKLATIETNVPIQWDPASAVCQPRDEEALKSIYRELEFFSLLKELGPDEQKPSVPKTFGSLDSEQAISAWLDALPPGSPVAIALRTPAPGELGVASFGLSAKTGEGYSAALEHVTGLRSWLNDERRPKIAHDVKALLIDLDSHELAPRGFTADVMLYAFLVCADPAAARLETASQRHLNRAPGATAEEHAEAIFELAEKLDPEIDRAGLRDLYRDIELPLTYVLARMAECGVRVESSQLGKLSEKMDAEIQRLISEIHTMAGRPFNISSPQQLGKVLFEEMKLPAPRAAKGKAASTAADVLEALAEEHQIVCKVLEYRQLTKLKGTYVDALPALIDQRTGRLHTTLNQTGAATGRLSSSNPNLQNIPIRTELGREIRAAFVPREGWKLLVADYSQIELRLLAHMSLDPVLVDAFQKGQDIHTRTAAEVFNVPPLMVTPEMRRNAKAVNFGIVYGQSAFGLAAQLGIDRKEAETYIRNYFERYAGVRKFIDKTIAEVRQSGEVRTLFGRSRPIPDINSRNPNARGFAERTAVNTPLQGTAADIIKLAMIRIDHDLIQRGMECRMLLQVHDELIFECPPAELAEVSKLVKERMEGVYRLAVPLLVDIGTGDNWRDAK